MLILLQKYCIVLKPYVLLFVLIYFKCFQEPLSASQYLVESDFLEKTKKLQGSMPVETLEVVKRLLQERPSDFNACVEWARKYWQEMFHNTIAQLLHNFPSDQTTSTGQPFWSGPKVCMHIF